ncbi:hypothetical protein BDW_12295 [Bdellovibrio bacteriovorus W]|nr:hypothetical protein BDW_12295 [Bdellovibrio bacteriovorus W]
MKIGKNLSIAFILVNLGMPMQAPAQTSGTIEDALPKLKELATPLSQAQLEFYINPILRLLENECQRPIPDEHKDNQRDACVLLPAWAHLESLMTVLKDPNSSPIQFSHTVTNPHLDQVVAGAWKKNIFARSMKGVSYSAVPFAAEVIITKLIVQKSLAAYSRWSVFMSKDPDNAAKTYIVPKLIQSLEGRSLLGGLFERYQQHKCSVQQVMASPGSSLCQIEKLRLAAVINTLYKSSQNDIAEFMRVISLVEEEGNNNKTRQLAFLSPLNDSLKAIKSSSDSSALMWSQLKNGSSSWKSRLESQLKDVTAYQISLNDTDHVSAYIIVSSLLALKDLEDLYLQFESLTNIAEDVLPRISSHPDILNLNSISIKEISSMNRRFFEFLDDASEGELE